MPCANLEPDKLEQLEKEGIIGKYDTSAREREKHDRQIAKWREKRQSERKKVFPPTIQLTLPFRYICTHPETKLEQEQTYTRKFEVIPPCPFCHEKVSLEFESYWILNQRGFKLKEIETYRCRKCHKTISPWKYRQLRQKTFMACPKKLGPSSKECGGQVKPQKTYPWIFECSKCHEVYPPDRKEELLNVKIEHRPQNLVEYEIPHGDITDPSIRKIKKKYFKDTTVYPEEDIIDGDLYRCPIYGGVKRVRWDKFCKEHCGYRGKI